MPPNSVLSDGTYRRLVGRGADHIEPWDARDGPARHGRPAPGPHFSRVPQLPGRRRSTSGGAARLTSPRMVEIGDDESVRHPPRRVRASGARRSASRCPTTSWRASRGRPSPSTRAVPDARRLAHDGRSPSPATWVFAPDGQRRSRSSAVSRGHARTPSAGSCCFSDGTSVVADARPPVARRARTTTSLTGRAR